MENPGLSQESFFPKIGPFYKYSRPMVTLPSYIKRNEENNQNLHFQPTQLSVSPMDISYNDNGTPLHKLTLFDQIVHIFFSENG